MNATFALLLVLFAAGIGLAIYLFLKRHKEQRAAHDARLRAMAQSYLAAARKKKAAEAAAAAKEAALAAEQPSPLAGSPREERECPFCAEPILKKAKLCKHCGREVAPLA